MKWNAWPIRLRDLFCHKNVKFAVNSSGIDLLTFIFGCQRFKDSAGQARRAVRELLFGTILNHGIDCLPGELTTLKEN